MGIELWFKDDLRNILLSVNVSSASTAAWATGPQVAAYRQGYQEALAAVALACGISPAMIGMRPSPGPSSTEAQSISTGGL